MPMPCCDMPHMPIFQLLRYAGDPFLMASLRLNFQFIPLESRRIRLNTPLFSGKEDNFIYSDMYFNMPRSNLSSRAVSFIHFISVQFSRIYRRPNDPDDNIVVNKVMNITAAEECKNAKEYERNCHAHS